MTVSDEHWTFRNKDHGKISAAASLVCLFWRDRLIRCVYIMEVKIVKHEWVVFPMLRVWFTCGMWKHLINSTNITLAKINLWVLERCWVLGSLIVELRVIVILWVNFFFFFFLLFLKLCAHYTTMLTLLWPFFLRHWPFLKNILMTRIHLSEFVLLWVSGLLMRVPKMIRWRRYVYLLYLECYAKCSVDERQ